jgi:hypothetical protein
MPTHYRLAVAQCALNRAEHDKIGSVATPRDEGTKPLSVLASKEAENEIIYCITR